MHEIQFSDTCVVRQIPGVFARHLSCEPFFRLFAAIFVDDSQVDIEVYVGLTHAVERCDGVSEQLADASRVLVYGISRSVSLEGVGEIVLSMRFIVEYAHRFGLPCPDHEFRVVGFIVVAASREEQ